MRLVLLLALLPAAVAGQIPDSLRHTVPIPVRDSAARYPVDQVSDLLPWIGGGALTAVETPAWHGMDAFRFDRRTDGIRWATGLRSLGTTGEGPIPVLLEPSFNAIRGAALTDDPRGPFTLDFLTAQGGDRWGARGRAESEGGLRVDGGAGTSRFEGEVGGPLPRGFRIRASATLLGRVAAPAGTGYGDAPYYVPTGIDTVMAVPSLDPLPDTSYVPIQRFGAVDRVPYTPATAANWAIRIDGRVGPAAVWAHWLGTRVAERLFRYLDIANPLQASGYELGGRDLAAGASIPAGPRTRVDLAAARQHERSERGPLSSAGERDTRDPTLGLMLGGLDLRFGLDNFAVDEELVANYRNNTPGSRRSPYDLENTAQYALVDQYRNDVYGLLGWSESGGPNGRLAFYEDGRTLVQGGVTHELPGRGTVRLGVELVRHDARSYSHQLTSQANSDVWIASPTEQAVTLDWAFRARQWRLEAGFRLDRFRTGASRDELRDTASFSPTFDRWAWFPRISSYGAGDPTLRRPVEDAAHTAFAPRARLSGELGPGVEARVAFTRSARMPDLSRLLGGLNTDLAITNAAAVWGTDMGHEITDLLEAGLHVTRGPWSADAAVFHDRYEKAVMTRYTSLYDPLRMNNADIRLDQLVTGPTLQGLTFTGGWAADAALRFGAAYTYADLDNGGDALATAFGTWGGVRRHSIALTTEFAPTRGPLAGFGGVVSWRRASPLALAVDAGYSPYVYGPMPVYRTDELPAWHSLDLRVTRRLAVAGTALTVYADGRNLLNTENLIRAFGFNDPTEAPMERDMAWANDSAAFADEAIRSGHYDGAGSIDLTFGGAGRGGCGAWVRASGAPSAPNCAYLIAAEDRFGDGDGIFTLQEQRAASQAYYLTARGRAALSGPPRAVRLGMQVEF